ncbi:GyrI-like domain-containing protein [Terrimonas rubra]|uniref:GyrI-like domain-containing protein n=1 Tax=Terrimonas rubra TaxID=1035890 RepID=A0ABW6A1I4_9BACT
MEKLDLTKKYKTYFTAKTKPEIVEIGPAQYLSIAGNGDPSGEAFAARIEALYSTAYTLKFACKAKGNDFVVSKLEGLWWYDENKYTGKNMSNASVDIPRSEWEYRLLIRLPDFVTESNLETSKETVIAKKNNPLVREIGLYTMNEGKCVQMLHIGPFATEPETLQQIMAFTTANKLGRNGLHHEIYLSDFRKTAPEKLKTILREPVK